MSGTIPASVGNLPDLTAFLLNGALSGTIPLTIGVWTNLQYVVCLGRRAARCASLLSPHFLLCRILQLGGNALSGSIPDVFGNMNQLYLLDLSGNRLIGNIPASLGACAMLQ